MRRRCTVPLCALGLLLSSTAIPAAAPEDAGRRAEYGVTLALAGDLDAAERMFVALLEDDRSGTALNNLGNIAALRGDYRVAREFYDTALAGLEKEPGIRLNLAAVLLLADKPDEARAQAARAIEEAGGPERALRLLGVPEAGNEAEAGGEEGARISGEEIRALLQSALREIPTLPDSAAADSLGALPDSLAAPEPLPPPGKGPGAGPASPGTWRPAGPRAAEANTSDLAAILYWKR